MKGFMLDEHGDVVIDAGEIQMVHGVELTAQTIKSVLQTQKGEWFLDWEEGINHNEILGKKRYATKGDAISEQYTKEIKEIERKNAEDEQALSDLLAKRLDGET